MKIQRFASIYDEMITGYNKSIEDTNSRISQQEQERDKLLQDYNTQYQNQLNEYQNLQNQQAANIDQWAETQREQQQKQTDYEIGLINQNKAEAEKQTKTEQANAYIDYQKGLNEFGGSSEELASQGLSGTGFAKNQDIAMNITYQNRVASANAALQKANTDYDNQIQQALLSNDANLAQLAYEQMQQQYQLALSGFEYRSNLWNQKLNYETTTRNTYFDRVQNYQTLIKNYQDSINAAQKGKLEQENWERELAEKQRQYDLSLAEEQRQFNEQMALSKSKAYSSGRSSGGGDVGGYTDTTQQTSKYADTSAAAKEFGVFSNGYQPKGISGVGAVSKSGKTVGQVLGTGSLNSSGNNIDNQNIWTAGGRYWIWDGGTRQYIDITSQYNAATKKTTSSNTTTKSTTKSSSSNTSSSKYQQTTFTNNYGNKLTR